MEPPAATITLPRHAAPTGVTARRPPVSRIDAVHAGAPVDSKALQRGIWRARIRRFGSVAAWIVVLLIILAIVVLGSRPAPTDFESLGGLLT